MKNRLFAVIVCGLAALFLVAGCGKKSPEDRLIGMVDGYAKILISNESDCSKAGKELDAYVDKNKADFTVAFTELMDKNKANDPKLEKTMKEFEEKYKGKFDDKKLEEIMTKCGENADFKAANEKLQKAVMAVIMSAMLSNIDTSNDTKDAAK